MGQWATPHDALSTPDDLSLPSDTTDLEVVAYCSNDDASAPCTEGPGGSSDSQILGLYGSQLTLSDPNLPGGDVTGGALAGSGPVSGTLSLAYTATDPDSGVRLVELLVDNQIVAQHDYGSLCPYDNFQACPADISDTVAWNTTSVPDGQHDLALELVSAAGDTAILDDHTITIANAIGASGETGTSAVWSVSLTVSPRRVHQHTAITLSGLVAPSPRPPAGKLIYLQARSVSSARRGRGRKRHRVHLYGPWITFHVLNADPEGRFSATYRFRLGGDHRYQMRAVAPAEGGFANPTGSSAPVLVTET